MAFGVSCALPLKRKIMVQRLQPSYQKEEESVPLSELLRPPKMQRTTRHSPERHLPTLATCGLSDSLFYGEQKWPRAKAFNISSQSLSSPYDHVCLDVEVFIIIFQSRSLNGETFAHFVQIVKQPNLQTYFSHGVAEWGRKKCESALEFLV